MECAVTVRIGGIHGRATFLRSTRSHVPRRVVKRNSHEFSYVHALTENSEFLRSRLCGFSNRKPSRWEMIGQCPIAAQRDGCVSAKAHWWLGKSLALPIIASPSGLSCPRILHAFTGDAMPLASFQGVLDPRFEIFAIGLVERMATPEDAAGTVDEDGFGHALDDKRSGGWTFEIRTLAPA